MSACKKSVPVGGTSGAVGTARPASKALVGRGVPSAPSDAATTLWRSLKEFENPGAYRKLLHNEFPPGASELNDEVSRRSFLKVMSASLALAGLNACTRQPIEPIVPY